MTDSIKERYYYCKVIIPNKGYSLSFMDHMEKIGSTDCSIEYTSDFIYLHFDRFSPSINHAIASIANNVKDTFKKYRNFTEFTIEYSKDSSGKSEIFVNYDFK